MSAPEEQLCSISTVAARLGFTYRHVRRLIARGELHAVNIGNTKRGPSWRITPAELTRFEDARGQA